jgi:mannose-6-phosphate isomerase-like protein (cupin superfamily)
VRETSSAERPAVGPRSRGFTLKHADEVPLERGDCGDRRRLFSVADDAPEAFIHQVRIRNAKPHYHRLSTEYYYVLEGSGTMVLDGEEVVLRKGSTLEIRPGTVHEARGDVLVLVIGVPSIVEADTYYP